ncbi:MAG: hypothetical protein AABX53_00320 [Nanoarchaeota archaeon]
MIDLKRLFMFAGMVVLVVMQVSALGITPGRTTLQFEPGVEQTVEFTVINSEQEDMQLVLLVQGELNQTIALSTTSWDVAASESEKKLSYVFRAPSTLTPGTRTAEIIVIKLPKRGATGATFVGAAVGVTTQLHVLVPYPGKYAEPDLNIAGPDDSGKVTFLIPTVSRGELDLVRVRATVEVYTALNEKIITLSSNEVSLASGARAELVAEWDASAVAPGSYRAVVNVLYDEGVTKVEKTFEVGKRVLELQNVEVNDFSLGEIAKFELLIENKWSQPISGAYADMVVYNAQREIMANFKSATYEVPALGKALLVTFWDTEGVKEGTYDSSVFLRYDEHSDQQDFKLKVSSNDISVIGLGYVISKDSGDSGESNTLVIVLATIIGVLVLINVLWFLVLRKKFSARK